MKLPLGTCATNQWHNPTTIISTPPALLFFYFTFRYFTKPDWKDIIICIFFAILTIYIKPSFIIAFVFVAPLFAAALLLLKIIQQIKSHTFRGKTFAYYFLQIAGVGALLVLLCGAILLDNERKLFDNNSSIINSPQIQKNYVKIDFKADFYKINTQNDSAYNKYSSHPILKNIADNKNEFFWRITVPFIFLLGVAYPLLVSFLYISKNKNDNLLLLYSGLFAIIGFLIALAFSEYGARALHGNLAWQVLICNTVFFMTAIVISIKKYFERLTMFATMPPDVKFSTQVWFYVKKYFDWRLACSLPVLFYHTGFGIHYLVDAFSRKGAMWYM